MTRLHLRRLDICIQEILMASEGDAVVGRGVIKILDLE